MSLLVTGGNGLLGQALRELCPSAVFAARRDADLTDLSQTRALFTRHKPSQVIHAAALVGGVKRNAEKNADFALVNSQINANVLTASRETGVTRLLSFLASCAFGGWEKGKLSEDDLYQGAPYDGNSGYGYSKRMLDVELRLISRQYGVHYSSLTPVSMYGPYDNWDLEDGHVVSALIHRCYLAKRDGKALDVWGKGEAVRQFIFVKDVARLALETLRRNDDSETMIVAAGGGIAIKDLVSEVAKAMDFRGPVHFDAAKPEGQKIKVLESRIFKSRYPDFEFTPLDQGLRFTVDWFLKNIAQETGKTEASVQ
ncbi:MAG: NAD-dependent epimerase/dehydratase family protein [Elusimicrobia bacterium]|nr:NAD-dependent epimerase/dehydratase family protein [Elusimicrobiota bacterium]